MARAVEARLPRILLGRFFGKSFLCLNKDVETFIFVV